MSILELDPSAYRELSHRTEGEIPTDYISYLLSLASVEIDEIGPGYDFTYVGESISEDQAWARKLEELYGEEDLDDDWYAGFLEDVDDTLDPQKNDDIAISLNPKNALKDGDQALNLSFYGILLNQETPSYQNIKNLIETLDGANTKAYFTRYTIPSKTAESYRTGIQLIDISSKTKREAVTNIGVVEDALNAFVRKYGLGKNPSATTWPDKVHIIIVDKEFLGNEGGGFNRGQYVKAGQRDRYILLNKEWVHSGNIDFTIEHELAHLLDCLADNRISGMILDTKKLAAEHGKQLFSSYGLTSDGEMFAELFASTTDGTDLFINIDGRRFFAKRGPLSQDERLLKAIFGDTEAKDRKTRIKILKSLIGVHYPGLAKRL